MWLICALAKWGTDYQWWILVKSIQGRSLRGASLQDWCHGTDTANWPTQSSYLEPLYLYRFCWAGVCHGCLIRWFSQRKRKKLLVSSEVADSPPLFIASLLSGIWTSRGNYRYIKLAFLLRQFSYHLHNFNLLQVFLEFRKSYFYWSHLWGRKYCKSSCLKSSFLLQRVRIIGDCIQGRSHEKNTAVLLDFVQIRGGVEGPAQFFGHIFKRCIFGQYRSLLLPKCQEFEL